ncbi:IS21-like element helper ATPase IstB [Microbacterium rhizosphaerae]
MTPTTTIVTTALRRRRGMTEEAAAAAVDQACRRLRLPTVRAVLDEAAKSAERDQLSYLGFLAELLLSEVDDRDRRSTIRRVANAGFPRQKWLADFDYDANPTVNPATIHTLAQGDWIRRGEPLCLIGDSGTGKSHLLIGFGTAAAEQGFRVRYTLATRLVNELAEAADDKQLARTIARYGRVDLLIIDELGYMELDRRGAELLFQVLTEREEKASIAIGSKGLLWMDQDVHRPPPLRGDSRPAHLPRHHHRDRHRLVPARPHPAGSHRTVVPGEGDVTEDRRRTQGRS